MDPKCLDLIESKFTDAFNAVQNLHDRDQLDECVHDANDLLQDIAMPRYIRIKTLMLLVYSIQDWKEAEEHRGQAEVLWRIERECHVEGGNEVLDGVLDDLRIDLDELATALVKRYRLAGFREKYDDKYAAERHMAAHREAVKKYEETADDEDELERIDLEILGMTKEQSFAILDRKAAKNNNLPPALIDAPSSADQNTSPTANLDAPQTVDSDAPPIVDPDTSSIADLDTIIENAKAE